MKNIFLLIAGVVVFLIFIRYWYVAIFILVFIIFMWLIFFNNKDLSEKLEDFIFEDLENKTNRINDELKNLRKKLTKEENRIFKKENSINTLKEKINHLEKDLEKQNYINDFYKKHYEKLIDEYFDDYPEYENEQNYFETFLRLNNNEIKKRYKETKRKQDKNCDNMTTKNILGKNIKYILVDTNILMDYDINTELFNYIIKNKITITVIGSVYNELIRMKDLDYENPKSKLARVGLNKIKELQELNLINFHKLDINTNKKAYADNKLIEFISEEKDIVLVISNDNDVVIKAMEFRFNKSSIALTARDFIMKQKSNIN